jgi:hypothetical protein
LASRTQPGPRWVGVAKAHSFHRHAGLLLAGFSAMAVFHVTFGLGLLYHGRVCSSSSYLYCMQRCS